MSPTKPAGPKRDRTRVLPPWTRLGDRRGKGRNVSPIVTVFGAGIAGLSAAHELIERGFSVQVVEPKTSPDEEFSVEVGGMASNQFGRVKENPLILHGPEPIDEDERDEFRQTIERVLLYRTPRMHQVQPRFPIPWRIRFARKAPSDTSTPTPPAGVVQDSGGTVAPVATAKALDLDLADEWGARNGIKLVTVWETIKQAYRTYQEDFVPADDVGRWWHEEKLPQPWKCREVLYVEIRGHTDGDADEATNRRLSEQWAKEVLNHLISLNSQGAPEERIKYPEYHFRCVGVGSAEPIGDQRDEGCRRRSNRVEFRIVEQLVPGEHGYRFFPAFYRHLFDTMRRTPILDAHDRETGQTAFERLVPTRDVGIALQDGRGPASLETRRVRSLEELRRHSELFFKRLGATYRDVARFQTRLLKFMTSSPERRRREYEDQDWWTFLGGDAERGYSKKMEQYLVQAPQALVAMNAEETDARSQGDIVSQLQLSYMEDRFDLTLNGPTTSVWLREWKRYLKRQGVRFFVGGLGKLRWDGDELVPLTTLRSGWLEPRRGYTPAIARDTAQPEYAKPPEGEATDRSAAAPVVHPARTTVEIEVMGQDDGDYTVDVAGRAYSFTSRGQARTAIARELARRVNHDEAVTAKERGTRIVITEANEVKLHPNEGSDNVVFDDSEVAGSWQKVRTIDIPQAAKPVRAEVIERVEQKANAARTLLEAIDKAADVWENVLELALDALGEANPDFKALHTALEKRTEARLNAAERRTLADAIVNETKSQKKDGASPSTLKGRMVGRRGEHPAFANFGLGDDEEWVSAGRHRAENEDFDKLLSRFEKYRRPRREIVPRIKLYDEGGRKYIEVTPPTWVDDVNVEEGPKPLDFDPLFPYYFRSRNQEPRTPVLWISVRDSHDNLRILGEPMPEDPAHDYLSHDERRSTFRPDFYVLALPIEEVSRLVWSAEVERPGHLDGCLAEVLEFDKRSQRRTPDGELIRVVRDPHGRPPQRYPLRDFSGIQYYFHNHVRIGKGHIYFPEAEWGLSSISQLAYWRERMSSSGAFMGQLSVDIGNFYAPAPSRIGGRFRRSAWHSTREEIVAEVWHQVRQGLESQQAGIVADPDYVHLDEGLKFDHSLGRTFRDEVVIAVDGGKRGDYTLWINGFPFTTQTNTDANIATTLTDAINQSPSGVLSARSEREDRWIDLRPSAIVHRADEDAAEMVKSASEEQLDQLQAEERLNPAVPGGRPAIKKGIYRRRRELHTKQVVDDGRVLLRIRSEVPAGAAFIQVTGADPGSYEIKIAGQSYRAAQNHAVTPDLEKAVSKGIRDNLFTQLVYEPQAAVLARPKGDTGLVLVAKMGETLPKIEVRNDHQNLSLTFGPTLHVRAEQCNGGLSFANPETATIGHNQSPFLINVPAQWRYRPGVRPPGRAPVDETETGLDPDMPVRYRVSNRRWVAAGTYMATTTRLTTMEAANESARHAVNAILRQLVSGPGADYSAGGKMFADWAEIWDPERNELDDLEPLRRLDQKLVDEGLPHVLDILRVIEAVDALPMHGQASHDPSANLLHLLQHAAEAVDRDWGFSRETLYGLVGQAAERMHDSLDPLGIFREGLKNRPGNILERLQHFVQGLTKDPLRKPGNGEGTPPER